MTSEKYQQLKKDSSVIKLNEILIPFFKSESGKIIIGFFFMHAGFPSGHSLTSEKRIILKAFPRENFTLGDIPILQIGEETEVMVNSYNPKYAMTFKLHVNESKQMVRVVLNEKPELGEILITDDEKNGIKVRVE